MGVSLDSHGYESLGTGYLKNADRIRSITRGLTGYPLVVESGIFTEDYDMTLLVTLSEYNDLLATFQKIDFTVTPPTVYLDFTDEGGIHWNPNSSGGGNVNTGVIITSGIPPKPLTQKGWSAGNKFTIQLKLLVNDNGSAFS